MIRFVIVIVLLHISEVLKVSIHFKRRGGGRIKRKRGGYHFMVKFRKYFLFLLEIEQRLGCVDLCKYSGGEEALPQRLQTSMSLYSNNLCGLVMLTDTKLQMNRGVTGQLYQLCQVQQTSLH